MHYEMSDEALKGFTGEAAIVGMAYILSLFQENANGNAYLVNLIDSSRHIDSSEERRRLASETEGGLVVVDYVEGVCLQPEIALH